jgi:hypothetical protein
MLSWKDYYVQEEMRKVRMEEAEHARLVKLVSGDSGSPVKDIVLRMVEYVGSRMVSWGDYLLCIIDRARMVEQG